VQNQKLDYIFFAVVTVHIYANLYI